MTALMTKTIHPREKKRLENTRKIIVTPGDTIQPSFPLKYTVYISTPVSGEISTGRDKSATLAIRQENPTKSDRLFSIFDRDAIYAIFIHTSD